MKPASRFWLKVMLWALLLLAVWALRGQRSCRARAQSAPPAVVCAQAGTGSANIKALVPANGASPAAPGPRNPGAFRRLLRKFQGPRYEFFQA